jgi:hypothetical protein
MRRNWPVLLVVVLPLIDFWWNLAHLNIGLVDFYGLSAFAAGYVKHGAWPATPYFPAGYPLLLIPSGLLGSTLIGGYVLSAVGVMLALYAAWLLAMHMRAGRLAGVVVIMLCWAAPVCRVVSGSPSVDALYTGLGLWFIASALVAWQAAHSKTAAGEGGLSRWVELGLIAPACALPLLRYHAVVLLIPVLLVLLTQAKIRKTSLLALAAAALVIAFNYASYYVAYHEVLASASLLQVWTGLEQHYHKLYPAADSIWNSYPQFYTYTASHALLQVYSLKEVAGYWLSNWMMFIRQPALLLLLALLAGIAMCRRTAPGWQGLGLLWAMAYTLALSCTYYTARAALLPVMLATALCCIALSIAIQPRWKYAVLAVLSGLLLTGYQLAGKFARIDQTERALWAAESIQLDNLLLEQNLWATQNMRCDDLDDTVYEQQFQRSQVLVEDWRLLPLRENPWTAPYVTVSQSWINDPRIKDVQRTGIERANVTASNPIAPGLRMIVADHGRGGRGLYEMLSRSPRWNACAHLGSDDGPGSATVFVRAANFDGGVDQAAP